MADYIKTNRFFTWRFLKDIKFYEFSIKIIPSRLICIFFSYSREYYLYVTISENIHKSSEFEPIKWKVVFFFNHKTLKNKFWNLYNMIKNGLFRIEMLFKPKKKKEIIKFIKGMEKND